MQITLRIYTLLFACILCVAFCLTPSMVLAQDQVEEAPATEGETPLEEEVAEESSVKTTQPAPGANGGQLRNRPSRPTARPTVQNNAPRPRVSRPPANMGQRGGATVNRNGGSNVIINGSDGVEGNSTSTVDTYIDFNNTPLLQVIESIALLTGKNFEIVTTRVQEPVTIITHEEIPPELAFQILESILASKQIRIVESLDGNLYKIVDEAQKPGDKVKVTYSLDELPEGYDGLNTYVIGVKHANAEELQSVLTILGSSPSLTKIDVYLPTNTLIITDTAQAIQRMARFLEQADVPGYETSMEMFVLEYTRAEVISEQLNQVLLDEDGSSRAAGQPNQPRRVQPSPSRVGTRPARPAVPGATSQVIGSQVEILRMVPDERLNALIVVANLSMMERVRDLVKRLDTPTPIEGNNLHIYELLNADAEMVEQALQPLVNTQPRRRTGGGGGGGAGGGGQTADVQPFERQVQITRYEQTNALLIVAAPQDYKYLESVIALLDVPQRQVHLDAIVMDVTLNDNYAVQVDAAGLTGNDGFGVTSTGLLSQLAVSETSLTDPDGNPLGAISTVANNIIQGAFGLGAGGGLTTGVYKNIEVDVNGTKVEIPFVPMLFQAIETVSDLEVLSQPSLMTLDNEEASFTVGQEVPFVTNQRRSNNTQQNNNQFNFNNFNSITREDVGVKLSFTPQISEGDNVLLQVELEVSDLDADQIGDVNLLGPTTNKSLINTNVLVNNGATAVLAGFIRDTANRRRNQVPIAGDLPVLGFLFRGKSNSSNKRNMVVLATPHIIKEDSDLDRLTQFKVNQYHDTNVDEFVENGGFFKKVKKKSKDRKKYRPTADKAESITGQRHSTSFNRGDIKR